MLVGNQLCNHLSVSTLRVMHSRPMPAAVMCLDRQLHEIRPSKQLRRYVLVKRVVQTLRGALRAGWKAAPGSRQAGQQDHRSLLCYLALVNRLLSRKLVSCCLVLSGCATGCAILGTHLTCSAVVVNSGVCMFSMG